MRQVKGTREDLEKLAALANAPYPQPGICVTGGTAGQGSLRACEVREEILDRDGTKSGDYVLEIEDDDHARAIVMTPESVVDYMPDFGEVTKDDIDARKAALAKAVTIESKAPPPKLTVAALEMTDPIEAKEIEP